MKLISKLGTAMKHTVHNQIQLNSQAPGQHRNIICVTIESIVFKTIIYKENRERGNKVG